jgi:hypothetical protein
VAFNAAYSATGGWKFRLIGLIADRASWAG